MSLSNHNNSDELTRLVDEHYQLLFRYAYRLSGDRADAEDLTQQTYLIAQKKLSQLRDPRLARSWLCTILRNLFLKKVSQKNSSVSLSLTFDLAAEETATQELTSQELQKALDELSEEFRVPLLMYYFEERSYKEISSELSVPIGTVMSRLSRAKSFLQERFSEPVQDAAAIHT
ncbi:RNA polymerase sigma factor [Gimesia sp.]|uniref:RNA polymerase sigma factor n=1 Tax=Gimesia sp. TaxID=2024833 RepID=UPI000C4A138D|nr:RNA polymerase sigma factor [Gimesia sp.]MAX40412.1 RNA polymerase subunit sigma [Gimesia sp.]HAH49356.1 RNA polymerase subunit sigma [Planctomycetaceae bacterium]HBL45060.1 RNA polymerase subunit sigma [Planctomycetaceae bacterium]|tara:strand:- start:161 stop:682 length:522 start_codon:yes stop_codon:yes gene_type:complete